MKKEVDSYEPNKRIPYCLFLAKSFNTNGNIPELNFRVKLIGAREPQNELTIYISPLDHN